MRSLCVETGGGAEAGPPMIFFHLWVGGRRWAPHASHLTSRETKVEPHTGDISWLPRIAESPHTSPFADEGGGLFGERSIHVMPWCGCESVRRAGMSGFTPILSHNLIFLFGLTHRSRRAPSRQWPIFIVRCQRPALRPDGAKTAAGPAVAWRQGGRC